MERFLDLLGRNCLTFGGANALYAVNISGDFFPGEFAAALHHLKPGKVPGPDSICPDLLIHAGPGLKFWLRGFLLSCLRQLKIPKVWRRALAIAILKTSKPVEQKCQTRGILEATLHVGNRAEGRMIFSIWISPLFRATVFVM